jgi:hypothetical protein
MYGIPIVVSSAMCGGWDSLLARRSRSVTSPSATDAVATKDMNSVLQLVLARSPEHLDAADDLVRKRYKWRGYEVEGADAVAESSQKRSSQELTFLAASGETAVGTLTLGLDGPAGLLAEAEYGEVIGAFRAAGHRMCELTRLALAERIDSKIVLAGLFSFAHAAARTLRGVTHVFIEVNPRHVQFYSRVLGFAVVASGKFCERVRAQSVLLGVELEVLEARLRTLDVAAAMQRLIAKPA